MMKTINVNSLEFKEGWICGKEAYREALLKDVDILESITKTWRQMYFDLRELIKKEK